MQNSKKLSVIIVNYRSEGYLKRCIASIYNQASQNETEIIVVNNDEKEELDNISKEFPEINIVNLRKNVGFGAANNIGVKKAQSSHLLFLNPDTEIIKIDIAEVTRKMDDDPTAGIIGVKIIDAGGGLQEWAVGFSEVNLLDLIRNNVGLAKKFMSAGESAKEIFWVSGAAFFMPKKLFWEVGGFDEKYFLYYEDVDLCKAVRKAGKKIRHMPEVVVKHIGGGSHADEARQKADFYVSQEYYFQKHFGPVQAKLVKILRKIFV